MIKQNGFIDPSVAVVGLAGVVIIAGLAFGLPQYGVYTKSLNGKAQLMEAEYTRQTAVLEAQAKKDSAQQLADAEVIRAQGVAKANSSVPMDYSRRRKHQSNCLYGSQ
jgi:predicted aminopeptidase